MTDGQHRNPFEGVTDYFSELGRMRSLGMHGAPDRGHEAAERTHASAWVPTTDILARGDDLVIRIELAGVRPDDVSLHLNHGVLTVSGTRPAAGDEGDFYVRERYIGEFRRVITLPDSVAEDDVEATVENGVVEVVVRGAAASGPGSRIALADRTDTGTPHRLR
ncbi:Hsp20/alpha crystallin family protein [Nocardioides marmoraquaticus]